MTGFTGIPGDILLWPVSGKTPVFQRLIGALQLALGVGRKPSSYSHAAICAESPGLDYEAVWPLIDLYRTDLSRPIEVWRVIPVHDERRRRIIEYCRAVCRRPWYQRLYDVPCLLTFGLLRSRHWAVCSEFVGRAYSHAGIHFSKESKRIVAPDAIPDYPPARLVGRYVPKIGWESA